MSTGNKGGDYKMSIEVVKTNKAPEAIGPYSQAIVTGSFVYTSGQIPINPQTGEVVDGGIEEQAKQVLENLKNVLEAAGSSLNKVVKTTVFIKDMDSFAKVNEVYAKYFSEPYPQGHALKCQASERSINRN